MNAPKATLLLVLLSVAVGFGGCQTTAGLTQPSKDFVSAATTLSQAESDYFDQIQAADVAVHTLHATAKYVLHDGDFAAIDKERLMKDDFSQAKKLRMAAMAQLQNYAAQIGSISSGAAAPWVATDAATVTSDVTTLTNAAGANWFQADAGLIKTAVTDLGQDIIDNQSAEKLQTLAVGAKDPIAKIAAMVQADNENIETDKFASGLLSDQSTDLSTILHAIYADSHSSAADRFAALQTVVNWKAPLVTKGADIQAALKTLQTANTAMAAGSKSSDVATLWQQVDAFATQALATPTPAKK
jgi:hypothetical protein